MDDGTHFYVDAATGEIVARRTALVALLRFHVGPAHHGPADPRGCAQPVADRLSRIATADHAVLALVLLPMTSAPESGQKASQPAEPAHSKTCDRRLSRGGAAHRAGHSRQRAWIDGPDRIALDLGQRRSQARRARRPGRKGVDAAPPRRRPRRRTLSNSDSSKLVGRRGNARRARRRAWPVRPPWRWRRRSRRTGRPARSGAPSRRPTRGLARWGRSRPGSCAAPARRSPRNRR